MIYIADVVQTDILKINKRIMNYKMTVYDLECYIDINLAPTQRFLKIDLIRKIFDLRRKEKRLEKKLKYLTKGNGLQPTWDGYKEN